MRILYVSKSDSVHDARFLEAWDAAGFRATALMLSPARDGEIDADAAQELREILSRTQPDLVQAGPLLDVGRAVAHEWSGPLLLTSWGFDLMSEVDESSAREEQATELLSAAAALITDNDASTQRAIELGMDPAGIVQFPWGIDVRQFTPAGPNLRAALGWDDSHWVVGCTRQHEPYYDVATVLAGFAAFADRGHPEARLLLVGDGSLTSELKQHAAELGIADRVVFFGRAAHEVLPDVYRTLNTYVSASHVDGTSISLLEAMASEVPVCVSDTPGNRQWVTSGTGQRFATGSATELARSLGAVRKGVAQDGASVSAMAERARESTLKNADWRITRATFPEIAAMAIGRQQDVRT